MHVLDLFFFYGKCRKKSSRLPIHVSDTAANSHDGSSLEFVAAATARECNIQDARGGGLCKGQGLVELQHLFRAELLLGLVDSGLCNEQEREQKQDRGRSSKRLGRGLC